MRISMSENVDASVVKAAAWLAASVAMLLGSVAQAQCSQWLVPPMAGFSQGTGGLPPLPSLPPGVDPNNPDGGQLYPVLVAGAPDGSVVVTANISFEQSNNRTLWVLRGDASGWTFLTTRPDLAAAVPPVRLGLQHLLVLPNGNVVTTFYAPPDGDATVIMWNGTQWQQLGTGFVPNFTVISPNGIVLATHPVTGEIYVGGNMRALRNTDGTEGAPAAIARWTGAAWSVEAVPTDFPSDSRLLSLDFTPDGRMIALHRFGTGPGGAALPPTVRVRNATWTELPGLGLTTVNTGLLSPWTMQDPLLVANGYLYVTGQSDVDGNPRATIRRYNGVWSTVFLSPDRMFPSNDMVALPDGTIVFNHFRGGTTDGLAQLLALRPDGTTAELGLSGSFAAQNAEHTVFSMSLLNNGRLAIAGRFNADAVAPGSPSNIALYEPGASPLMFAGELQAATVSTGQTVTLTATPWAGLAESVPGGISYEWKRRVATASPGGVVSGAAGVITTTQPITLTIDNAQPGDSGAYELRLRTACQTITYQTSVTVQGQPGCDDIDFNNNTVFPEEQDVIDFFTVLAGGSCP